MRTIPFGRLVLLGLLAAPLAGCGKSPTEKAAEDFGLTGRWAPDCTQPPSRHNPYTNYDITDNGLQLFIDVGDSKAMAVIDDAKILAPDRISLRTVQHGQHLNETVRQQYKAAGDTADIQANSVVEKDDQGRTRIRDTAVTINGITHITDRDGYMTGANEQPVAENPWRSKCH